MCQIDIVYDYIDVVKLDRPIIGTVNRLVYYHDKSCSMVSQVIQHCCASVLWSIVFQILLIPFCELICFLTIFIEQALWIKYDVI